MRFSQHINSSSAESNGFSLTGAGGDVRDMDPDIHVIFHVDIEQREYGIKDITTWVDRVDGDISTYNDDGVLTKYVILWDSNNMDDRLKYTKTTMDGRMNKVKVLGKGDWKLITNCDKIPRSNSIYIKSLDVNVEHNEITIYFT